MVKADGYGHGAAPVARAALEAGAAWLGRGPGAARPPSSATPGSTRRSCCCPSRGPPRSTRRSPPGMHITVYTADWSSGCGAAARRRRARRCRCTSRSTPACTGSAPRPTTRVGAGQGRRRPARRSSSASVWTHCAVADEPDDPFTAAAARALRRRAGRARRPPGIDVPLRHAANSAGGHRPPGQPATTSCAAASPSTASRRRPGWPARSTLRAGRPPGHRGGVREAGRRGRGHLLRPAPPLRARHPSSPRCRSATPTACSAPSASSGQEVLIGGRRCPMVGVVTMDQVMVDVGPDSRGAGRRRGRAPRRPGRRAHHPRRVGGAARHDRLRGGVRHRRPGRAPLRHGVGTVADG